MLLASIAECVYVSSISALSPVFAAKITVLYCTVLYCTVLYCTVLYCNPLTLRKNICKNGTKKIGETFNFFKPTKTIHCTQVLH